MVETADVVVVGGGIIGCSTAYEMARAGFTVALFERETLAAGASGRNHGLLLAPLDPALVPMARASTEAYVELSDAAPIPFRLDDEPIGFLLASGPDEAERAAARREMEAATSCGVAADHLDAGEVRELEPNLTGDLVEAWLLHDGRRLDPAALTVSFGLLARDAGARVATGVPVRSLVTKGDRVTGVLTDDGPASAGTVVVAAGPWSAPLLRRAGVRLPVTGARGWLVSLDPAAPVVRRLVGRAGWHVPPSPDPTPPTLAADLADGPPRAAIGTLLQPNADGTVLVGGSRQRVVTSEPEDPGVPLRLTAEAIRLAPPLAGATVLGSWWGIRPATPDGRPFVGRVRDGLVVATGHGAVGVILGGGTARLVAALVAGAEPPFDPEPFEPGRT